ncbi:uncharacterized protein LOC126900244 [Daktulosphaira vitifoliae]|uniref:uncharacterized protein LOC126900244 n=1 Tax=Daktulosphaira vitifoliae TaxID=58002 RepID=UPI0021AA607D|nr:uncharacterized protein LOC126900244 [Daktulosphaira vitifoliae]
MSIVNCVIISICVVYGLSIVNVLSVDISCVDDWSKIIVIFNEDGLAAINLVGALHIARHFSYKFSFEDIKNIFSNCNVYSDEYITAFQIQTGLRKYLNKRVQIKIIVNFMKQAWKKTTFLEIRCTFTKQQLNNAFKLKDSKSSKFKFEPESPEYINGVRIEINNDNTAMVDFKSALWIARIINSNIDEELMTKIFNRVEVAINENLNVFQLCSGMAFIKYFKHVSVYSNLMKKVWEKTTREEIKKKFTVEDIKFIFRYNDKLLIN